MEIKVKPKAVDDDQMKTLMKECVMFGQEADEAITKKGQDTMKIVKSTFRQNQDYEIRQDDSKNDSRSSSSSSSSTSPSLGLEIMKKLEIDNNEKSQPKKEEEKKNVSNMKHKKTSSLVWDCGSTLYDSFELNSFKRQLDSAISASSARTMSMSHLPDRRLPPLINSSFSPETPPLPLPLPPTTSSSGGKKHSNKISRSLQRFLKSVFRPKQHQSLSTPSSPVYKSIGRGGGGDKDRYYVVYDKSGSLTTIPESTEKEVGPEMNSLVRKTVSERFPASRAVGISCA